MLTLAKSMAALFVLAATSVAQSGPGKDWSHHTGKVPFVIGYDAGLATAKESGKPLMLFLTTTWCGWCKKLAADSFSDEAVAKELEAFVPVIVDGDVERDVIARFDIGGYPDVRFVTVDGQQLGHVGGYVPKAEFRAAIAAALRKAPASSLPAIHADPEAAKGLAVGQALPSVDLTSATGEKVSLQDVVRDKPTLLVFYRGGWCPFCTRHLADLGQAEAELRAAGFQIVAISPDPPEKLASAAEAADVRYTLLSDAGNAAARRFQLAFRLDEATVGKYKGMGLDLSGSDWTLPVPAAFLVDAAGKIAYAHVDPDYKSRLDSATLLKAAQATLVRGPAATSDS